MSKKKSDRRVLRILYPTPGHTLVGRMVVFEVNNPIKAAMILARFGDLIPPGASLDATIEDQHDTGSIGEKVNGEAYTVFARMRVTRNQDGTQSLTTLDQLSDEELDTSRKGAEVNFADEPAEVGS